MKAVQLSSLVFLLILSSCSSKKVKKVEKPKKILIYSDSENDNFKVIEGPKFLYEYKGGKLIQKRNLDHFTSVWIRESYLKTAEAIRHKNSFEGGQIPADCGQKDSYQCFHQIISGKRRKIGINEAAFYTDISASLVFQKTAKMGKNISEKQRVYLGLDLLRLSHLVNRNIVNPRNTIRNLLKSKKLTNRYKEDISYQDEVQITLGTLYQTAEKYLAKAEQSLKKIAQGLRPKLKLLSRAEKTRVQGLITKYMVLDKERILKGQKDYDIIMGKFDMDE